MHKLSERERSWKHVYKLLCMSVVLWWGTVLPVSAQVVYEDVETGYAVVIEDDANLLSDGEEMELQDIMRRLTAYGNAAFKTIDENDTTTESYIQSYYSSLFGSDSGTVFLIDMDNRNIWIHSNGDIYSIVRKRDADTITDNVYTYASQADYYICAYKVFEQELTLLQGEKIARPMKYISNAFLAVILALLVNYGLVRILSTTKKVSGRMLLEGGRIRQSLDDFYAEFTHQTKVYDPPSSSGGGSSGSGGGGGSSGGGGGHSF